MRSIFFILALVSFSTCGFAADWEMLKIKHRAKRGFDNNGRVIYRYVDDQTVDQEMPNNIGSVRLDRRGAVREVHIGVDLNRAPELQTHQPGQVLSIGNVDANGCRSVRKVNIIVDMEEPIKF